MMGLYKAGVATRQPIFRPKRRSAWQEGRCGRAKWHAQGSPPRRVVVALERFTQVAVPRLRLGQALLPHCPLPESARPMAPRQRTPTPFLPPRWRTFHPPRLTVPGPTVKQPPPTHLSTSHWPRWRKSNSPGRGETKHPKPAPPPPRSLVLRSPACLPALRASLHARSQKIQKRKPVTWLRLIAPDRLAFPSALRPRPHPPSLARPPSSTPAWLVRPLVQPRGSGRAFLLLFLLPRRGEGRNRRGALRAGWWERMMMLGSRRV